MSRRLLNKMGRQWWSLNNTAVESTFSLSLAFLFFIHTLVGLRGTHSRVASGLCISVQTCRYIKRSHELYSHAFAGWCLMHNTGLTFSESTDGTDGAEVHARALHIHVDIGGVGSRPQRFTEVTESLCIQYADSPLHVHVCIHIHVV